MIRRLIDRAQFALLALRMQLQARHELERETKP